jgi:hypothetical protein
MHAYHAYHLYCSIIAVMTCDSDSDRQSSNADAIITMIAYIRTFYNTILYPLFTVKTRYVECTLDVDTHNNTVLCCIAIQFSSVQFSNAWIGDAWMQSMQSPAKAMIESSCSMLRHGKTVTHATIVAH